MLEHFVDALVQVLDVLVGIVGECVARATSPEEAFRLRVEQIDDQRAYLVCVCGGRCFSEASASKSSPTPAAAKPVVERIQGLLILRGLQRNDRDITAGIYLGPAFCRQSGINRRLYSVDIQGILGLHLFPRVGFVLPEVRGVIIIGLHLLCRSPAREQKHHSDKNNRCSF